jgi:hypothetical protein
VKRCSANKAACRKRFVVTKADVEHQQSAVRRAEK